METILIPVDFSPASYNASIYAAEMARLLKAKLILFHSYMLPTPVSEVPYVMITVDELQKENEALIKKDAEKLHNDFGVEVEWLVRIGIPSDETKAITEERNISMIVIGMRGAGGLDKIIGSTTTNVIRKVKTPVLIIPHDTVFQTVQNITYASDFSYSASPTLFDPVVEIAKLFNARIHIIHVKKENGDTNDIAKHESGKEKISQYFRSSDHDFVTLSDSSIMHGINQYLHTHSSELLVMVAHKHSFFERVFSKSRTTSMAYETRIPLLVLQDKG